MQFWNELEGRVIENRYPLGRLLRSEGRTAWFETQTQDENTQSAIISLTESLTDQEEVLARLQAAQQLKHPNLLEIRRIGKAQIDQTLFVYAVMEHTDQNLSDVLREQVLSKEEARQLAAAMTGALTAIHQKGLAHGRVEPASILAIGEAIKLRSDCLQSPGASRAGDVAGIGATLFEAFTQRKASAADDAQINRIPAPFAEIIRNSLSARWGLAQIETALKPPGPLQAPIPIPLTPPAMPGPSAPIKAGVAPIQPPPAPVVAVTPSQSVKPREPQPEEKEAVPSVPSRHVALYIAVAVVLALILGWLIERPKTSPSAPAGHEAASPVPAPPPQTTPSVPVPQPEPSAGARASIRQKGTGPAHAPGAQKVWRVVAYTYHHQDQAQHKADEINRAHPGLEAEVFNPSGDPNHYLVVIGGALDSHGASQMRDKAVHAGLAADTYIQGFQE